MRYALLAMALLLAVGCSPKPYVGDARDLHAAMGSRASRWRRRRLSLRRRHWARKRRTCRWCSRRRSGGCG